MELLHDCRRRKNGGFTLVELVVVLVILAILAAILIPAMTGWIDKSHEKVCAYNRAQLQRYYTYEKSLYYQDGVIVSLADVLAGKYKETADDVAAAKCPSKGVYSASGEKVVCSIHGDGGKSPTNGLIYNGSQTSPDKYLTDAFNKGGTGGSFTGGVKSIDSTAQGGTRTTMVLDYLAANGLDLSAQNVQAWKIQNVGGSPTFFWTDQNISTLSNGDMVRVIQYNPKDQTYTAAYMKVQKTTQQLVGSTSTTYNVLTNDSLTNPKNWSEYAGQDGTTKSSYEETLKIFNGMNITK